jgi:hypothetical protein
MTAVKRVYWYWGPNRYYYLEGKLTVTCKGLRPGSTYSTSAGIFVADAKGSGTATMPFSCGPNSHEVVDVMGGGASVWLSPGRRLEDSARDRLWHPLRGVGRGSPPKRGDLEDVTIPGTSPGGSYSGRLPK